MNQTRKPKGDAFRADYNFSRGMRGRHHAAYKAGSKVVVLDPDVAKAFPNATSVNRALRMLLEVARRQSKRSA